MAHRAGNSLLGISTAAARGFELVELDVHLSRDGVVVVHASPTAEVAGRSAYIADLDLRNVGPPFLTLDACAAAAAAAGVGLVVDVKQGPRRYPEIGEAITAILDAYRLVKSSWIVSYDHDYIRSLCRAHPGTQLGVIYTGRLWSLEAAIAPTGARLIVVEMRFLDHETIAEARDLGITVMGAITPSVVASDLNDDMLVSLDLLSIDPDRFDALALPVRETPPDARE